MPETCAECRWWDRDKLISFTKTKTIPNPHFYHKAPCRFNPLPQDGWCYTEEADWCGQFAAREVPTEATTFHPLNGPDFARAWTETLEREKNKPPKAKRWMVDTRRVKELAISCDNCRMRHDCDKVHIYVGMKPVDCPAVEVECASTD